MSESLSRLLIAVSTALLIVIAFAMIILSSPSMLVGIEADEPIELVIERASANGAVVSTTIDPNTATAEELMTLPNLGEVLAARIIAYRSEKGAFSSLDDLLKVEGIGSSRLSLWEPYLTIE